MRIRGLLIIRVFTNKVGVFNKRNKRRWLYDCNGVYGKIKTIDDNK